jgi:hypothetical protein
VSDEAEWLMMGGAEKTPLLGAASSPVIATSIRGRHNDGRPAPIDDGG